MCSHVSDRLAEYCMHTFTQVCAETSFLQLVCIVYQLWLTVPVANVWVTFSVMSSVFSWFLFIAWIAQPHPMCQGNRWSYYSMLVVVKRCCFTLCFVQERVWRQLSDDKTTSPLTNSFKSCCVMQLFIYCGCHATGVYSPSSSTASPWHSVDSVCPVVGLALSRAVFAGSILLRWLSIWAREHKAEPLLCCTEESFVKSFSLLSALQPKNVSKTAILQQNITMLVHGMSRSKMCE